MKFFIYLLVLFVLGSCAKNQSTHCDNYWIQKKHQEWKYASCTNEFRYVLYKAQYKNQTLYYNFVECMYCKFPPPSYGFNCTNDTISISNWNLVKDAKVIARCGDFFYPH